MIAKCLKSYFKLTSFSLRALLSQYFICQSFAASILFQLLSHFPINLSVTITRVPSWFILLWMLDSLSPSSSKIFAI